MDGFDSALLGHLQRDSNRSIAELSDLSGLSMSACHRRIKSLEEHRVITGYVAILDPTKLGIGLHAFVDISLVSQSEEAMVNFERAVADFEDILECHLMSGPADYVLRIAATDFASYDNIHRTCLSRLPGVSKLETRFAIRRIKEWVGYPVRRTAR